MYLTGMSNIRDVLPYPRTVGTLIVITCLEGYYERKNTGIR